jgi:hypothetical protein
MKIWIHEDHDDADYCIVHYREPCQVLGDAGWLCSNTMWVSDRFGVEEGPISVIERSIIECLLRGPVPAFPELLEVRIPTPNRLCSWVPNV